MLITARCYASAVYAVALCLSVGLSVTSLCSAKTAKRRIAQATPYNILWDSSLVMPKILAIVELGQPNGDAK